MAIAPARGVDMQEDSLILRDVALRLRSLAEAARLRPMAASAGAHLQQAKSAAASAEPGSRAELHLLREAADASSRLTELRGRLETVERELRRTAYLLEILSEDRT